MIRKLIIIAYAQVFDFKKKNITIGGVQTYVKDLAKLAVEAGIKTAIYAIDPACNIREEFDLDGFQVIRIPAHATPFKSAFQKGFDNAYKEANETGAVFVICTDQMDINSKANNVISIQHGIAFDIPGNLITGFWGKTRFLQLTNKVLRCLNNVRRFNRTRHTVCVDYNYYNWFRTIGTIYPERSMDVIPNYTSKLISSEELQCKLSKPYDAKKKIVFARRFVEHRGTLLFADVVERILRERNDVLFTFAGNGPLEDTLRKRFANTNAVDFTHFSASESIDFHSNYDIAVVPTIFSEGTSLSLCEAMAAGCLPISTHVGGLTNMLLDGYNGLLSQPSREELYKVLNKALDMSQEEHIRMVQRTYESARFAFSFEKWGKRWLEVLNKYAS